MIIDLPRFVAAGRPLWSELEKTLDRLEADAGLHLDLAGVRRLDFLYQRVSSDLARLATFAAEPDLRRYLEALTARAYGEMHETRERGGRFSPWRWLVRDFPLAFRRHVRLFRLALLITLIGCVFGGVAVISDPAAKEAVLPFDHLQGDPNERVAREEHPSKNQEKAAYATFSTTLMTHNIRVSLFSMALGTTWGLGTIVLLFYNGIILGAVALDYMLAGQTTFLFGWLLPHGVIEIPAILIASQAGLLLGRTLIGKGNQDSLSKRLREIGNDLCLLIYGVAVMLVWAGLIEAFVSQFHAPKLPYSLKISFGLLELLGLIWFLNRPIEQPHTEK